MKKYHMRKKEREITDENEIKEILTRGKYLTISLCRDNEPYIVTLSYGYDEAKNALYMHTALSGLKVDFISYNPNVCATIIEDRGYLPGECAHAYGSVVFNGTISAVENLEEKKYGMEVLLKHLEDNPSVVKERSLKNDRVYDSTAILRLDIKELSGKKGR